MPLRDSGGGWLSLEPVWELADLGYETSKRLWFLQMTGPRNEPAGMIFARSVKIDGGLAHEYGWKDTRGSPGWHVRERFYNEDVQDVLTDGWRDGAFDNLTIRFAPRGKIQPPIPKEYNYVCYAYKLRTGKGFVEFFKDGKKIQFIDDKLVIVEGIQRQTAGEIGDLRLKVPRESIAEIVMTESAVILRGDV